MDIRQCSATLLFTIVLLSTLVSFDSVHAFTLNRNSHSNQPLSRPSSLLFGSWPSTEPWLDSTFQSSRYPSIKSSDSFATNQASQPTDWLLNSDLSDNLIDNPFVRSQLNRIQNPTSFGQQTEIINSNWRPWFVSSHDLTNLIQKMPILNQTTLEQQKRKARRDLDQMDLSTINLFSIGNVSFSLFLFNFV